MAGGTAGSAKPPVLLSSVVFGLPVLFVPRGGRQTSTDLELLSWAYSSRALHRFIVGTDRSPDWFRLLSHCLGRAGRHRRTGGTHSIPDRFLLVPWIACHFNVWTELSGWHLTGRLFPRVTARIHALNGVVLRLFSL